MTENAGRVVSRRPHHKLVRAHADVVATVHRDIHSAAPLIEGNTSQPNVWKVTEFNPLVGTRKILQLKRLTKRARRSTHQLCRSQTCRNIVLPTTEHWAGLVVADAFRDVADQFRNASWAMSFSIANIAVRILPTEINEVCCWRELPTEGRHTL